jgi:hypothetical protein
MKRAILYGIISLAVLGPLLGRGYILTLDMVFTPELRMPDHVGSSYLFHAGLHYLNAIIPADILQKIMLLTIFITAGWGAHALVEYIQHIRRVTTQGILDQITARIAAGCLYMINPFTYERLMTGQYAVLLGYALLPWFTCAVLQCFYRPSPIPAAKTIALALAISIVSIHTLGMIGVIIGIGAAGAYVQYGLRASWKLYGRYFLGGFTVFAILSSYWLIPLLSGKSQAAQQISRFNEGDRLAFATSGSNFLSQSSSALQLRGFWAERHELFTLPWAKLGPLWQVLGLSIIALVIAGLVFLWQNGRSAISIFLASMIVVGALCTTTIFGDALAFGPFAGFREPQKFAMLVALAYSVGFGFGIAALLGYWTQTFTSLPSHIAAATACLAIPFLWTIILLWGANGQFAPRQYPAGWFAVNDALNQQHASRTLLLPWHLYMHMDFAGRTIANPAPHFFDTPVLTSNNPELEGASISIDQPSTLRQQTAKLLRETPSKNLATQLHKLGISNVILAKEHDYHEYDSIVAQSGFIKIIDTPSITLYSLQPSKETRP